MTAVTFSWEWYAQTEQCINELYIQKNRLKAVPGNLPFRKQTDRFALIMQEAEHTLDYRNNIRTNLSKEYGLIVPEKVQKNDSNFAY